MLVLGKSLKKGSEEFWQKYEAQLVVYIKTAKADTHAISCGISLMS